MYLLQAKTIKASSRFVADSDVLKTLKTATKVIILPHSHKRESRPW
jgi:hypothetical protein